MVIVVASSFVKTRIDHCNVAYQWTMNLSQASTEAGNSCPQMKIYHGQSFI